MKKPTQFAILGIGRFGLSILQTLAEYDVNIMVCDKDQNRLHHAVDYATHVIQADISDETTLETMGLGNYDAVIIAMAEDFEASLMATIIASEKQVPQILVKARSQRQKQILLNNGATKVVLPEYEMGQKIARKLISPNIIDILDESEHYSITEMTPRKEWIGKSIRQANIRQKHNLTILAVRHKNKLKIPVSPDLILSPEDSLIILNEKNK